MMIPRQFHFVFGLKRQYQPFHIAHFLCLESCLMVNRPDSVHFHCLYEPYGFWWDRIREKLQIHQIVEETFVTGSSAYSRHAEGRFIRHYQLDYAHQSDFIRLKILIDRGGVYADIDTLFVSPLPDSLFTQDFVAGAETTGEAGGGEYTGRSICNAVLMSRAGSSFARRYLEEMYRSFDGSWSRHSCGAMTALAETCPEEIHVLPQICFYKHPSTARGIHRMLMENDDDYNGVYSMHLWQHLWWDSLRKDFSSFHSGMLTESYIREVDTTYNVIARRFLP